MSTSASKSTPLAVHVTVQGRESLSVDLDDGRTIIAPMAWFPRLMNGTDAERQNFEVSGSGIHWPDLDEDISVEGLLSGQKSGESLRSLAKWLETRSKKTH
ncbi:MAG: DUF2442 domain-containing protein [Gemmataceae bacterium]|nr:DUF2442 domain-containing protein [Gemmataceae bacterium]